MAEKEKTSNDAIQPLETEWLDTNGTGGYASSTLSGCNTRKYHGLLVSRLVQPPGKFVLLSKLDDEIFTDDHVYPLTVHRYRGGNLTSEGLGLTDGTVDKTPLFKYRLGPVNITKELALVQGEETLLIRYSCTKNSAQARLRIRPLLAYRDFHTLTSENLFLRVRTYPVPRGFLIAPYDGMPPLYMQCSVDFEFFPAPCWYRGFEYPEEMRRGFDAHEDLFCPGVFEIALPKGSDILLSASLKEQSSLTDAWKREMEERRAQHRKIRGTPLQKALGRAARQFVSTHPSGRTSIVAGFPWFLEWGRDAMIALPGLLLDGDDDETYLRVLRGFAEHQRKGLIPNYLGNTPWENAYNSADASLWFAYAVQQYLRKNDRPDGLRGPVAHALQETFRWYRSGTDNHIGMLDTGLVQVGSEMQQLTWMDATVDGAPVTSRHGCPVEINALWFNLLSFLATEGSRLGLEVADDASSLLPTVKDSFNRELWIPEGGYLADRVLGSLQDKAVRCNQIFAVSLPFSPLSETRQRQVVEKVEKELFTPLGLRTLSPRDPRYRGKYRGTPRERDSAYHNGTVWPWLLGHYGEALLKVSKDKQAAVKALEQSLTAFERHLTQQGLGTISEVFDGDEPKEGLGCISQAWSVAEIIRLSRLVANARAALDKEH